MLLSATLANPAVSASCSNGDRREAHRHPANAEENLPHKDGFFRFQRESGGRTGNRDQFVSVGIAKIGEIRPIGTHARRVLD